MKKVVLMAILMILAIQVLCAQQLWPEPVNVVNSTFYDYNSSYSGKSELTDSQGNTYVFIKEYRPDGSETRLYKFSPTWQETWLEPLNINIIEPLDMIETSDGDLIFSVFQAHSDYSAVTLHKITPEGIRLWPESGIIIPGTTIGSERCAIAPDESGGAYLVYSHGFNYSWGEWRYQQINASGILSPSQAILLKEFEDNPGSPQIKTLPGNKVVVSVFSFTEASVICLGDQNQILWRKDHSGRSKIITTSEGTTYAAFSEANSLLVYKYDQNGTNLWTEPLSLDAGPWSAYTEIELSPDQSSIYLYWVYDNSGDRLAKISQNQELVWIRQSPFMDTETISLVPDALGGLFLYGYYYQSSIGRLWAHHLNSLGQETTQPMVEIPIVGYQDQPRFSGKLCGEELRLIYGYNQDVDRGIKAQKISSTGELGYGQTGLDLIAGLEVITAYHTLGKIGDKAIVVWGQRIPNGDKFQLQYQIYNSDGSPQFNNPILLTTSARYIVKVNIYEDIGVGAQIVWLETQAANASVITKLQIIAANGEQLLEQGGQSLVSTPYYDALNKNISGFWDGKLFLANLSAQPIRIWCFLNGVSQWDPQGIVIANPNDLMGDSRFLLLDNYYLVWNVRRDTTEPSTNVKCTHFDANGLLVPYFSLDGLPAAITNSSEWGLSGAYAAVWGDKLFVQFFHLTQYWSELNDWWEYYSTPTWQLINPNASWAWGDLGLTSTTSEVAVAAGDYLYVLSPYANNYNYIDVRKLNCSADLVWSHRIQENNMLYRDYKLSRLDDDNFILSYLASPSSNLYEHVLHYGYFDAQGIFTIPDDNILATYSTNFTAYQQIVTENSVYIMTSLDGGRLCQLFKTANPSPIDDPVITPALEPISIESVYPNPFNPQTTIQYKIRHSGLIKLEVYNLKGQLVKGLVNENIPSGSHNIVWDGKDNSGMGVASGVYFLSLNQNGTRKTHKLLLMK